MRNIKLLIYTAAIGFLLIGSIKTAEAIQDNDFQQAEEVCYKEFVSGVYPQGLCANWGGVFSTYLPSHKNDESIEGQNKNHNVSIQSVNLLARYVLSIGDRARFDEMLKLWAPKSLGGKANNFISQELPLAHWLLDADGRKIPENEFGNKVYVSSTAEQLEVVINLYLAHQKFTPAEKNSKYERLARYFADGLKGGFKNAPEDVAPFTNNYILRPLFKWDAGSSKPVEPLTNFSNLESNSLEAYYYIATWLKDPYYQKALDGSIELIKSSQAGSGLFRTEFDLKKHEFDSKPVNNLKCNSLAGLKLSLDLIRYSRLSENIITEDIARKYLDFMIKKYSEDGCIYASYFIDTGAPFSMLENIAIYARLARLAMEFNEYGFAKEILENKILPCQIKDINNDKNLSNYLGAFKDKGNPEDPGRYINKDGWAFCNLEALLALYKWNKRQGADIKPYQGASSEASPSRFVTIPLIFFVNNDGITDKSGLDGDIDGYGWGFYGPDLPEANTVFSSMDDNTKFIFPDKRTLMQNNIECLGQDIEFASEGYSNIHFLAIAHNGNFQDELQIIYDDGTTEIKDFKLGDWWNEPLFGKAALKARCVNKGQIQDHTVYLAHLKITLDPLKNLHAIKLPLKDNMHIFGITLERPSEKTGEEAAPLIDSPKAEVVSAPVSTGLLQENIVNEGPQLDSSARELIYTILTYQMENGLTSYQSNEKIGGDYSWGLFIFSMVAAYQNGYISRELALEKVSRMLKGIEKLPKYSGWLYKYYDLATEKPSSTEIGFQGWYLFSLIVAKQVFPELALSCDELLKVNYSLTFNKAACFLYGDYDTVQKKGMYPIPLGPSNLRRDSGFSASERRIAYVMYTYLTGDKKPWYLDYEPPLQSVEGHEFLSVWQNFNFDIAHLHYALPEIGYYKKSWDNFVEASKKFIGKNGLIFMPMREGKLEDLRDNTGYPNTECSEATPALTWYFYKDAPVMEKVFTAGHGIWRYYDTGLFYWTYGHIPAANGYIGNFPKDEEDGDMAQTFSFSIDKDIKTSNPPRLKSISIITSIPEINNPPYGNLTILLNGKKAAQIAPSEVKDIPTVIKKSVDIELRGGKNVIVLKNDNQKKSRNNIYNIYRYEHNLINTQYGYDKLKFNLMENVYGYQYTAEKFWVGNDNYPGSILNITLEGQKSGPEVEDTCTAFLVRCAVVHDYYVYNNLLKDDKFLDSLVAWVGNYCNEASIARIVYNVSDKPVSVSYKRPDEWVNSSYVKVEDLTDGIDISNSVAIRSEDISWLAASNHSYYIKYNDLKE